MSDILSHKKNPSHESGYRRLGTIRWVRSNVPNIAPVCPANIHRQKKVLENIHGVIRELIRVYWQYCCRRLSWVNEDAELFLNKSSASQIFGSLTYLSESFSPYHHISCQCDIFFAAPSLHPLRRAKIDHLRRPYRQTLRPSIENWTVFTGVSILKFSLKLKGGPQSVSFCFVSIQRCPS